MGAGTGSDSTINGTRVKPLITGWENAWYTVGDHPSSALTPQQLSEIRKALYDGADLSGLKGYVKDMTFTGCAVAENPGGKTLLDIISHDIGADVRAFTSNTWTYGHPKYGVMVTPHPDASVPAPKNYGDFVYETNGSAVKQ